MTQRKPRAFNEGDRIGPWSVVWVDYSGISKYPYRIAQPQEKYPLWAVKPTLVTEEELQEIARKFEAGNETDVVEEHCESWKGVD